MISRSGTNNFNGSAFYCADKGERSVGSYREAVQCFLSSTAEMIEQSIARANAGNTKVTQVAESVAGIEMLMIPHDEGTRRPGQRGQQAEGIEQMSQAFAQMEKVTQTTAAATAEERAAASEELSGQAEAAGALVTPTTALVGGETRATHPGQPATARSAVNVGSQSVAASTGVDRADQRAGAIPSPYRAGFILQEEWR